MPARRFLMAIVPLAGVVVCLMAILSFVLTIVQNLLPWSPSQSIREHYLAVGQSYSQGFMAGFFLCLFLMLAGVVVTGLHHRRPESVRSREIRAGGN